VTDTAIFREDLATRLQEHEGVDVDAGYSGHDALKKLFPSTEGGRKQQYVLGMRL
jgi:hypothetical protein